MRKITTRLAFTCLLFSVTNALFSQPDKYYTVQMPKEMIAGYLTDQNFGGFIFTYTEAENGYFGLSVAPVDKQGNMMKAPEKLVKVDVPAPRPLNNLYKGLLDLPLQTMIEQGMDGSSDIYMVPKRYHEGKPDEMQYVSYRLFDQPVNQNVRLIAYRPLAFKTFDLNPSPPGGN